MVRCSVGRIIVGVCIVALFFTALPPTLCAADDMSQNLAPERLDWRPDQLIVKFQDEVDSNTEGTTIEQHACTLLRVCEPAHVHLVAIPASRTPEELASEFLADSCVEYAELNYRVRLFFEPNDPYFVYQWDLDNPVNSGIHMKAAWDIERGDPNVVVAVLDTGIAYEDFGSYRRAPDLAWTRFVPGYNFVDDDDHPNDDNGHGTHVTGTIAQSTNNGLGVCGIAFNCSIMPVKAMDATGEGDYFAIAQGIYFAVQNGAKVINMSLGAGYASNTLRNAVAYAYQNGVTVVCAAGNNYQSDNAVNYPAAYDQYCISVGATRYDEQRAYYSNTGSHLDVVAPGGDLLVDQNGDGYPDGIVQQTFTLNPSQFGYYFFQGTSMATPHVSGLAALLVSHGVTAPDDVRKAIQQTAVDLGPTGWDEQYGWGLIDAAAALNYFALIGTQ